MPLEYAIQGEPTDYLTNPLESWTVRDLTDALGYPLAAAVVSSSEAGIRQMRHRGSTSQRRFELLQNAVRTNEDGYRKALVSKYTNRKARQRA